MAKGKVLIVDDEKDVRDSLKLCLESEKYNILEAENGEEAINTLKSEDHLVSVGVILCDIRMPKVDGLECIEYFRREAPGIPVIVVTGFADTEMAVSLLERGCKNYLVKPVDKDKLLDAVNKVVSAGKDFKY